MYGAKLLHHFMQNYASTDCQRIFAAWFSKVMNYLKGLWYLWILKNLTNEISKDPLTMQTFGESLIQSFVKSNLHSSGRQKSDTNSKKVLKKLLDQDLIGCSNSIC